MTPQTLAGDTVLAWQTSAPPPTAGQPGPATLAALDAATGRLRWRWPAKLTLGSPLVVAGGLVAITTIAAPRLSVLVVDLATGKKVTTLANGAGTCVADDRSGDKSLVACAVGDDRGYHLATLRAGDHRLAISKAPIPDAMLHRVWQGYVFAASGSMRGDIAIDDAANTLSVDVPGDVVDIDGRYAIFSFYRTADHRHGYVVRRIVR
jgi:outer membrane protein assembly factor BamB